MKNSDNTTIASKLSTFCSATTIATIALLTNGCSPIPENLSGVSEPETELTQTAFRFRTDAGAPLNTDSRWAAPVNKNISVPVDSPFRIRFEVESISNTLKSHVFGLQYKYNNEEWVSLPAEDFPYPVKKYAIDFSEVEEFDIPSTFDIIEGSSADFVSQRTEDERFLSVKSDNQPLLAMGQYNTLWEAVEFGLTMRVSKDNTAGLVFGYENAQNYYLVEVKAGGDLGVVRISDGKRSILSTQPLEIKADQWIQLKVVRDGSSVEVEYEWDDFIQGIAFTVDTGNDIPVSKMGVYLPAHSTADFEQIEIGGNTYSPRTSVISSHTFDHGETTKDLLRGSDLPYFAGTGISYGKNTPQWSVSKGQGEWEFPIVIRYFFDGAQRNLAGDTIAFRLIDEAGMPLQAKENPMVTVTVPDGHLGGTFVETPVRIGPWEASNGDLYVLMEPSETDNMMMTVKSEDGGKSWFEVDGEHRPETGDLEGVAQTLSGDSIHTLHQTSEHVFYHVFNTSDHTEKPDTWVVTDENLASPVEPPTQVSDIAVRSDGSVVGVYGGPYKVLYKVRSSEGEWGAEVVVDDDVDTEFSGPILVLGKDDSVHFAYTGNDGSAWYRQILPDNTMTQRVKVASDTGTDVEDNGAILPLVYLPQTDTVSIVYRLSNGELWERTANSEGELSPAVKVTSHLVVSNAADSEQAGADAAGFGTTVHVLYIEQKSGNIYYTYREKEGAWKAPQLQVDDVNALWVRGQVIKQDKQSAVYGYVYDAGSYGGSGMNKYSEVPLNVSQ